MPIIIDKDKQRFILKTKSTMYAMEMYKGKFPVHLYYGKKDTKADLTRKTILQAFSPLYPEFGGDYTPDTALCEFPLFDCGDYRACALKLRDTSNGSDIAVFTFSSAKKYCGRNEIPGLPFADADEKTETLELTLTDNVTGCVLKLFYTVFPECDVISRSFSLTNNGKGAIRIEKCMILALDIPGGGLDLISFHGGHAREMGIQRQPVMHGMQSICSRRGASSHQDNPFFLLAGKKATENNGDAYAFNLVYSGSFLNEIESDQCDTVRVLSGLGSECFSWLLEPGEAFCSPEAVMTYSSRGIGQASRNMHGFVRSHISPPEHDAPHPVVLNSWEGCYFDINEEKMLSFAKSAAECGMDMLVMDDGWFGARNADNAGLGDWFPNTAKFPEGLVPFIRKVKANGIKFGIWIEPEMVNPNSDLFRAHPDWAISSPGREQLFSRTQLVLDMGNPEVLDYLKSMFTRTLSGSGIDYIKWDMNRHMSEVYSKVLPPERQGEASYRYMLGVYDLYRWFIDHFPGLIIENCSGGGGRYDLGMMKYSTQIWTSDHTDPFARMFIQYGASFGYPASVMSCHVSNARSAFSDSRLLDYAYRTAAGGMLGYEMNILDIPADAKAAVRKQIDEYRTYESLIRTGELYRLLDPTKCGRYAYYYTSADGSELLLTYLQQNDDPACTPWRLALSRAQKDAVYKDVLSGKEFTGAELRHGLSVTGDGKGSYGMMMHLVKQG